MQILQLNTNFDRIYICYTDWFADFQQLFVT